MSLSPTKCETRMIKYRIIQLGKKYTTWYLCYAHIRLMHA